MIFVVLLNAAICLNYPGLLLYQSLLALQLFFYFAAIIGAISESKSIKIKVLFIPFYFCMMNYATILGTFRYFKGKQSAAWEKSERASPQPSPKERELPANGNEPLNNFE
jgi:hypothetical protein